MDNAAWTKSVVTVTPDALANPSPPGDGTLTADSCAWGGATRALRQLTSLAVTGLSAGGLTINPAVDAVGWTRFSVTQAVDGVNYCLSLYLIYVSGAGKLTLSMFNLSGAVRVNLVADNAVTCGVWGWQLEVGSSPSTYVPRTT